MTTIKLVLKTNKKRSDDTIPIYLRITANRKSRHLSTGIAIQEKHWNANKRRIRRSHPQHAVFNDQLEKLVTRAHKAKFDIKDSPRKILNAETIKRELKGENSSQFFSFANEYADNLDARGKYWEWKKVNVLINKLKDFTGGETLVFEEIDTRFLSRFERHMRDEYDNATNTIAKNLQLLQRIIKEAVRQELISAADNPFLHYTIETEKTTKKKLSIEKVEALANLDLEDGSYLKRTRDAFLFSFYCAGIRFGDLCRLKWKHITNGRLDYQMAKTGTHKSIKLVDDARAILEDYQTEDRRPTDFIFPFLDNDTDYSDPVFIRKRISARNVVVNRKLKDLAKQVDIEINLSFHISRHSFADYARKKGIDLYNISKALGHSSVKQTETYLKSFDEEAVDGAMDELFGSQ